MKKTYIQPAARVMNINGRDAMMAVTSMGIKSGTVTSGQQLSRDEEMLWDEEDW